MMLTHHLLFCLLSSFDWLDLFLLSFRAQLYVRLTATHGALRYTALSGAHNNKIKHLLRMRLIMRQLHTHCRKHAHAIWLLANFTAASKHQSLVLFFRHPPIQLLLHISLSFHWDYPGVIVPTRGNSALGKYHQDRIATGAELGAWR